MPVAALNHERTRAERSAEPIETTRRAQYATTIAVVNADQFEFLVADHGWLAKPIEKIEYAEDFTHFPLIGLWNAHKNIRLKERFMN